TNWGYPGPGAPFRQPPTGPAAERGGGRGSPAQPERATGERRGRGHPEPHGHERRARGGLEPASNESNSCLLVLSGPCLPCQRHWDRTPRAGPRPRGRCRREGRSAGACAYVFSNYSCLRRAGGDCQRKQLLPTEQLREELQLWTGGVGHTLAGSRDAWIARAGARAADRGKHVPPQSMGPTPPDVATKARRSCMEAEEVRGKGRRGGEERRLDVETLDTLDGNSAG
ncbi:unnamed protein product, partial [Prorocentrum cordatum]